MDILWKFTVSAEFREIRLKICRSSSFAQNFDTRKLDEILVYEHWPVTSRSPVESIYCLPLQLQPIKDYLQNMASILTSFYFHFLKTLKLMFNPLMPGGNKLLPESCSFVWVCVTVLLSPGIKGLKQQKLHTCAASIIFGITYILCHRSLLSLAKKWEYLSIFTLLNIRE